MIGPGRSGRIGEGGGTDGLNPGPTSSESAANRAATAFPAASPLTGIGRVLDEVLKDVLPTPQRTDF